jgi:two-component system, sensor histidine kinase PdtaS
MCLFLTASAQDQRTRSVKEINQELSQNIPTGKRCDLLLDLAFRYTYKPGSSAAELDSALLLSNQATDLNKSLNDKFTEAKIYLIYSGVFRQKTNGEKGRAFCQKSIDLFKLLPPSAELGEAYMEMSRYYDLYAEGGVQNKKQFVELALPIFRTVGTKEEQADVLKTLADLNQVQRNLGLAVVQLDEALALYNSIGKKDIQDVYDLFGTIYAEMGNYTDAVKYGLQAVRTAEAMHDTTIALCTIYNRLGVAYSNWSKNDVAIVYLKKAMGIAAKYNDLNAMKVVLGTLSNELVRQKNYEESLDYMKLVEDALRKSKTLDQSDSAFLDMGYAYNYTRSEQFDKAKPYVTEMIRLVEKYPERGKLSLGVYNNLVHYFIGTKQYATAEKYMTVYLSYALLDKGMRTIARAYELRSRVDSALGNFQSALINYQSFKKITDSMLNESTAFQFSQIQVQYETEKKDNNIKLLTQQAELKEIQLKQSRFTNNAIIGAIIMLIVLLGLLYNRYYIKQKNNKQLQLKQEEINQKNTSLEALVKDKDQLIDDKDVLLEEKEWLLKEIHHRVKNNLQIVISLLNTQSKYLNNEEAIAAIAESRHRMQAMSLIHQKLYQGDNTAFVNMQNYIQELTDYLKTSFSTNNKIRFDLQLDDIELDISQAIPIGLILNETITNAIKYAFSPGDDGVVAIVMQSNKDNNMLLEIHDNGVGLPHDFNIADSNSMGMRLIKGLVKQVGGKLQIENDHGARIKIEFIADTNLKTISANEVLKSAGILS